ncbi:MAG: hypothetical protein SFX72_10410 [Isosphaeraceae bacterium]|nr:hypothetical protein [Isosphaeraceae bacterium]
MSLDPFDSTSGSPHPAAGVPGPITDLIIVYGGWGATDGGEPLTADETTGAGRVLSRARGLTDPPGRDKRVLGIQGNLSDLGGVEQGLTFIRRHFHPLGRLIIYGYSAGGTDALALCRAIWREIPNYDVSNRSFLSTRAALWHPHITHPRFTPQRLATIGWVAVDLLITIDAAAGPFSGGIERAVPGLVRWNLNYYQTTRSLILSRGGPNSGSGTGIRNVDLTGRAEHSTIDELTADASVRAIELIRSTSDAALTDIPTAL